MHLSTWWGHNHNTLMEKKPHLTHNTWRLQQEVNRIAGETSYSREEKPEDKIQPSHSLHICTTPSTPARPNIVSLEIQPQKSSKKNHQSSSFGDECTTILTKMTLADIWNKMTSSIRSPAQIFKIIN